MVADHVLVKTFFYLRKKKVKRNIFFCILNYFIPLMGDVELFEGILTRGDDDDGPAANCEGGVPRKKNKFFFSSSSPI